MRSSHLQRAQLLYQQHRYDMAANACREALLETPQDAYAHALLGLCLLQQHKYDEASAEAALAVNSGPDMAFAHYASGVILQQRNRFEEAEAAAREAVRLEPWDAAHWALVAQTLISRQRWREALDAADRGLEADPDNAHANNLRAIALVKLGDNQAAAQTIGDSLARDPLNADTHANQGWTLLHQNNPQQALVHFGEALRLEPTNEWARDGTVHALKAHHLFYRLMLRYYLWMSKFNQRGRWGIIIGLWLGFQLLRGVQRSSPQLAPFIYPLLIAYALFVIASWLVDPLFNLSLLLNKYGRYLLTRVQRLGAVSVGLLLLAALAFLAAGLLLNPVLLILAAFFGLLVLPTASTFSCPPGKPLALMGAYTLGIAAAFIAGLVLTGMGNPQGRDLVLVALWASLLSGLAANFLMSMVIKK